MIDYLHTHPESTLRYTSSDMCLRVDSDTAYIVAPGAKSRISGYYYLSSNYKPTAISLTPPPSLNAPYHVEYKLLEHVVSSSAAVEAGGIYSN